MQRLKSFRLKNRKLIARLASKDAREAFVERHVRLGIAYQLRSLRDSRGWTQKQLSKESGVAQADISKYESTQYGKMSVATLRKLAGVFDVALLVKFVPFSDLVEMEQNLGAVPLAPPHFEIDRGLHEETEPGKDHGETHGIVLAFSAQHRNAARISSVSPPHTYGVRGTVSAASGLESGAHG